VGPRASLSTVLIIGAAVLLVSIAVGNSMGNRVLSQIPGRVPDFVASPAATPTEDPADSAAAKVLWKRRQVLSVATDPGFPDPRVTPPTYAAPRARPRAQPTQSPSASTSAEPQTEDTATDGSHYTSPPLPIPIVSHAPGEQSDPYGEPLPTASPSPGDGASGRPTASPEHTTNISSP